MGSSSGDSKETCLARGSVSKAGRVLGSEVKADQDLRHFKDFGL